MYSYTADIHCAADKPHECVLIINPQNPDQSGEKLKAILKAARKEFAVIHVFLQDTLQSCFSGTTVIARKKGTQWIEDHRHILGDLADKIVRWDVVKNDPGFAKKREAVEILREFDKNGRQIIHMACARYAIHKINVLKSQGRSYDERTLMRLMVNYAQEEIAGIAVIHSLCSCPELYVEERYGDQHVFGRLNQDMSEIDLTIPKVYEVTFMIKYTIESEGFISEEKKLKKV